MEHIEELRLTWLCMGVWLLQVKGKNFAWCQRTWHRSMVVAAVVLMVSSVTASIRNIISSSSGYHIFKSNY
jgi:steroid 5-alpha reductase family enzyme